MSSKLEKDEQERLRRELVAHIDKGIGYLYCLDLKALPAFMERLSELDVPPDGRDYFEQRFRALPLPGPINGISNKTGRDVLERNPSVVPKLLAGVTRLLSEELEAKHI